MWYLRRQEMAWKWTSMYLWYKKLSKDASVNEICRSKSSFYDASFNLHEWLRDERWTEFHKKSCIDTFYSNNMYICTWERVMTSRDLLELWTDKWLAELPSFPWMFQMRPDKTTTFLKAYVMVFFQSYVFFEFHLWVQSISPYLKYYGHAFVRKISVYISGQEPSYNSDYTHKCSFFTANSVAQLAEEQPQSAKKLKTML